MKTLKSIFQALFIALISIQFFTLNIKTALAQIMLDPETEAGKQFIEKGAGKELGCGKLDIDDPKLMDLICYVLYATEYLVAAAGAVSVLFIAWGSYKYMYELRHPGGEVVGEGRKVIYHAIIGLVVCVFAYIIITVIIAGITEGI